MYRRMVLFQKSRNKYKLKGTAFTTPRTPYKTSKVPHKLENVIPLPRKPRSTAKTGNFPWLRHFRCGSVPVTNDGVFKVSLKHHKRSRFRHLDIPTEWIFSFLLHVDRNFDTGVNGRAKVISFLDLRPSSPSVRFFSWSLKRGANQRYYNTWVTIRSWL